MVNYLFFWHHRSLQEHRATGCHRSEMRPNSAKFLHLGDFLSHGNATLGHFFKHWPSIGQLFSNGWSHWLGYQGTTIQSNQHKTKICMRRTGASFYPNFWSYSGLVEMSVPISRLSARCLRSWGRISASRLIQRPTFAGSRFLQCSKLLSTSTGPRFAKEGEPEAPAEPGKALGCD